LECKKKGMDLVNIETPMENSCLMLMIENEGGCYATLAIKILISINLQAKMAPIFGKH
jgi:hypothetical protein